MKIAIITAAVLVAVFMGGYFIGLQMSKKPDAVTNSMLQEKIDSEAAQLNDRLNGIDSKLDVLLNVATNAAARDFRR